MQVRYIAGAVIALSMTAAAQSVTYNKDVLPVLQKNCQTCHRPGQIAPMSFLTYQSTRPWAKAMKAAVAAHKMPPWNADPKYGHFGNDRSLKQADIDVISTWADTGALEGDAKDAPAAIDWPANGWQIKPDLIAKGPEYKVPARTKNNVIEWTNIVMPGAFKEDTWVTSIEVKPSELSVTHHICLQFLPHREGVKYGVPEWVDKPRDESGAEIADDKTRRGNFFTKNLEGGGPLEVCYLPGIQAADYRPFGAGKFVAKGTDIIWQVHYTPTGKELTDYPEVGFTVSKTPPARQYVSLQATGPQDAGHFSIPPGNANWEAPHGEAIFEQDAELVWLSPHMHLRGKDFKFELVMPDGRRETLLNVPQYDFNWQLGYDLAKPVKIPKGAKLVTTSHFDNSPNNKFNPDPSKAVHYGNMTWEEMYTGFFAVTVNKGVNPNKVLTRPAFSAGSGG